MKKNSRSAYICSLAISKISQNNEVIKSKIEGKKTDSISGMEIPSLSEGYRRCYTPKKYLRNKMCNVPLDETPVIGRSPFEQSWSLDAPSSAACDSASNLPTSEPTFDFPIFESPDQQDDPAPSSAACDSESNPTTSGPTIYSLTFESSDQQHIPLPSPGAETEEQVITEDDIINADVILHDAEAYQEFDIFEGHPIEVEETLDHSLKKRKWDRKNFCIFCQSLVTNFTRHLTRWHKFEKEVMEMNSILDEDLKERKKKRQVITDQLRRRGNFLFNSTRESDAEFLPTKRLPGSSKTKNKESSIAYMTCRYCLGMFSRKTFYRHRRKCSVKPETEKNVNLDHVSLGEFVFGSKPRTSISSDGITFMPHVHGASPALKEKILPLLQKDELCSIALNDSLILSIGSHFLANHLDPKHKYSCTQKIRDAAQLLKACRSHPNIKCLADCMKPEHFYFVVQKVQELCGLEIANGHVAKVGMPARLSYILHEGAKIILCKTITDPLLTQSVKENLKKTTHEFLDLIKIEWCRYVSTNAENTRKKNKCKKDRLLPDDDDIKIVSKKIKEQEEKAYESLKEAILPENYEELCKLTIAHMIVLNRRRANEVARAELEFYLNRTCQEITQDVLEDFSPEEVKALGLLEVFSVPGKNDNNAPILFTQEMKRNIDFLISCRSSVGIEPNNPLLFARTCTSNSFDGCKIIRELRQQCNLNKPEHFTSIGLRHHLATKTGIKGDEKYTDNVCQFLSHTKSIHLKNYRVPMQAIQRGKIGNHLLGMEGTTSINQSKENLPVCNTKTKPTSPTSEDEFLPSELEITSDEELQAPAVKRKKQCRVYRRWSEAEIDVVLSNLGIYVSDKKLPGRTICSKLINSNLILAGRKWEQVNALIHNYSSGKTKLPLKFKFLK